MSSKITYVVGKLLILLSVLTILQLVVVVHATETRARMQLCKSVAFQLKLECNCTFHLNLAPTVFTRLSTVVLFKYLVFQMWLLFGGNVYLRVALFKKIITFVNDNKQNMLTRLSCTVLVV